MPAFRSADEFREVMDQVFTLMSTDPDMGPKLRDARVPQRFEFPDQHAVVNITYDDSGGDQNLRWKWSDAVDWEPQVEMKMDSDVANKYFQGKENVPVALARRRIKSSGEGCAEADPDHEAGVREVPRAARARVPAPAGLSKWARRSSTTSRSATTTRRRAGRWTTKGSSTCGGRRRR
jgi:hypothetical protein